MFIRGKAVALQGDTTTENDTYSLPSGGEYVGGAHNGASGSVTSGSSKMFLGGRPVAMVTSSVRTHAGTNTTISSGDSKMNITS